MKIAIITGASSGIGRAFAQQLGAGGKVDELWLIARSEANLAQTAAQLSTPCRLLPFDLTAPDSIPAIAELLAAERPQVEYLITAAGFGKFANYADLPREEGDAMIQLNCAAAVDMTVAALPYMGRGGHILEMVSASAFQPLPGLNIYAATKAFMLSYTRALRWELRGRGIKVTAVCPGWVKTDFLRVAQETEQAPTVRRFPFAARPETIARRALRANGLNFAVATCSPVTFLQRFFAKLLPAPLVMGVWNWTRRG